MIGRLTGRIVEDGADGTVVLDVHGVGYEVSVPLGALGRATPDGAGAVTLLVHTVVREDAFQLYGFPASEDRAVFRALIGVASVGPRMAMGILGALSVAELADCMAQGNVKRLTAVPGVGKKTAERLVLELRDKLAVLAPAGRVPADAKGPAPSGAEAELLRGALTRMGFRSSEADRALSALGARVGSEPLGDLVRDALALLSR